MSGVVAGEALEFLLGESAVRNPRPVGTLEPSAPSSSIPVMPQGVTALLRRCFQADPRNRPKDMQEAAAALALESHHPEATYNRGLLL